MKRLEPLPSFRDFIRQPEDPPDLWDAWLAGDRSPAVRNALIVHYAPLCRAAAVNRAMATGQLSHWLDDEDLAQDLCTDVLPELLEAYDPARSESFTAFAAPRLAKRVISCQREHYFIGRVARDRGDDRRVSHISALTRHEDDRRYEVAFDADGDRRDSAEEAYRAEVLDQLDPADAAFCYQRFWLGMTGPEISKAHDRCTQWFTLRQRAVLPKLLEAMGRADLVGRRPAQMRGKKGRRFAA